jgi:hypothetical protein
MTAVVRRLFSTLLVVVIVGSAIPAAGQVFVYPRRAGKSNPKYSEFDWRWINRLAPPDAKVQTRDPGPRGGADLIGLVKAGPDTPMTPRFPLQYPSGPTVPGGFHQESGSSGEASARGASTDDSGASESNFDNLLQSAGGFRLYFYESERSTAQKAAVAIEDQYRDLIRDFSFSPPATFPFILYNTYQEFLQTNLFPIQEGTLGVTSPRDLKLSLPYFGDHRQFERVSKHELVHQFTIQKVERVANENDAFRSPLGQLPLWLIEGMAEFYTHGGLDPETEMLMRDLTVNQAPRQGYFLGDFFDGGPYSFLWIYKMGQARCAFLEETYGDGFLQRILEKSYLLGQGDWEQNKGVENFPALLQRLTGDSPDRISARFEDWLKQRAYAEYLETAQGPEELNRMNGIRRIIRGIDSREDGNVMVVKSINRTTGHNRLFLMDPRAQGSWKKVVADGRPGLESLHPLEERNFDISDDRIAFTGRSKGVDHLFIQDYTHTVTREPKETSDDDTGDKEDNGKAKDGEPSFGSRIEGARFNLKGRTRYDLSEAGIVAAESPAMAPEGDRVAFLGLSDQGQRDIYIMDPEGGGEFTLAQITDTEAGERGLDWGPDGLVYASSETGHGRFNLFRIEPAPKATPVRLTSQPNDQFDPVVLADGRVAFVMYDRSRANIHFVNENGSTRRTNVRTGLFNPSPGPDGDIWALHHHAGRRKPTRLVDKNIKDFEFEEAAPDVASAEIPEVSLEDDRDYNQLALRNWRVDNGLGLLGVSGSGFYGQLYATASDLLRNNRLVLDLVAFGNLRRTDGALTYINQSGRLLWGLSLFQDFSFRVDETFSSSVDRFISYDRFYGARGLVRYPFSEYMYLQFSGGLGGVSYFLSDGTREYLRDETPVGADRPLDQQWKELNDSPRFQTEAGLSLGVDTIRYNYGTGPLSGGSLLASITGDWQPFRQTAYGQVRVDGEYYIPIYDRINAFVRMGAGAAIGGRLARQFFLSSFYTLRGVPFGNDEYLLGRNFFFSTAELQIPLNFIVRVPFIDVEGIVGVDFGGVGDSASNLWDRRVLDLAFGANFGFGPIVLRLHFAKPFDIGGLGPPNNGNIVPNFSIGWRYL